MKLQKNKHISILFLLCFLVLSAASVKNLNNRAQKFFDGKKYNKAIELWLNALEIEPENEKIQQKIELIYEIKQKKDLALQKSRLNYKIARKEIDRDFDKAKKRADIAIKQFIVAYRLDPTDPALKDIREDMKLLDEKIRAILARERLSRELKAKRIKLLLLANKAMDAQRFKDALKNYSAILKFFPKDQKALEGRRKSKLAIDNIIKFEKIRQFMIAGKGFLKLKKIKDARLQFVQVLNLDPGNREARDFLSTIDEKLEGQRLKAQRLLQAEEFYRSGKANIKKNRFSSAKDDFDNALALIPKYKDTERWINNLDRLKKDYQEKKRLQTIREIGREFQNGIVAYTEGRYRDAIVHFEKTLSLDKTNKEAKDFIQKAKEAQKEEEQEKVDVNSPYYNIVHALASSGIYLFKQQKYFESRKRWDRILQLFPKNKNAMIYFMKCNIKLNPQAYKNFSIRVFKEGKDLLKKKKFRDALKKFELIKGIDPTYPQIALMIRRSSGKQNYVRQGNLTRADVKTIDRRYKNAMRLYNAGGARNIKLAYNEFLWIRRRTPNNVKVIVIINKLRYQLGGVKINPVDRQQRLTRKQRLLVRRYYNNGINYYANNQYRRAIRQWRRVLAIDPRHRQARNNIRKTLGILNQ